MLHGFTGNPSSMRFIAKRCADEGFSVALPRLPGHGTSLEDMMTTSWDDWSSASLEAYDALSERCERVAVLGLSMGGGLCAFVAQERQSVAGCVFINPLVKPASDEVVDGIEQLLDAGVSTFESIGSDIKKEGTVESSYEATPLAAAKSLFNGIRGVYERLDLVRAPSLLLCSREDHVVSADNGDDLVARVGGPIERVWLENSYHVATIDNDQELVETLSVNFLRKVLPQ